MPIVVSRDYVFWLLMARVKYMIHLMKIHDQENNTLSQQTHYLLWVRRCHYNMFWLFQSYHGHAETWCQEVLACWQHKKQTFYKLIHTHSLTHTPLHTQLTLVYCFRTWRFFDSEDIMNLEHAFTVPQKCCLSHTDYSVCRLICLKGPDSQRGALRRLLLQAHAIFKDDLVALNDGELLTHLPWHSHAVLHWLRTTSGFVSDDGKKGTYIVTGYGVTFTITSRAWNVLHVSTGSLVSGPPGEVWDRHAPGARWWLMDSPSPYGPETCFYPDKISSFTKYETQVTLPATSLHTYSARLKTCLCRSGLPCTRPSSLLPKMSQLSSTPRGWRACCTLYLRPLSMVFASVVKCTHAHSHIQMFWILGQPPLPVFCFPVFLEFHKYSPYSVVGRNHGVFLWHLIFTFVVIFFPYQPSPLVLPYW